MAVSNIVDTLGILLHCFQLLFLVGCCCCIFLPVTLLSRLLAPQDELKGPPVAFDGPFRGRGSDIASARLVFTGWAICLETADMIISLAILPGTLVVVHALSGEGHPTSAAFLCQGRLWSCSDCDEDSGVDWSGQTFFPVSCGCT